MLDEGPKIPTVRPYAGFDIEVGETQRNQALSNGLVFFENHFSGLIFWMGNGKKQILAGMGLSHLGMKTSSHVSSVIKNDSRQYHVLRVG